MDFLELDNIDFDVILGMNRLHSYFASVDYQNRKVIFKFPNKLVIEWEGFSIDPYGKFIAYLKAQRLISNGCLY